MWLALLPLWSGIASRNVSNDMVEVAEKRRGTGCEVVKPVALVCDFCVHCRCVCRSSPYFLNGMQVLTAQAVQHPSISSSHKLTVSQQLFSSTPVLRISTVFSIHSSLPNFHVGTGP